MNMRKFSLLVILLSCAGVALGNCWTQVNPFIGNNLRSVVVAGNDTCFIAGDSILLESTNAGVLWTKDTTPQCRYNAIAYTPSKILLAVSDSGFISRDSAGIVSPYIVQYGYTSFTGCAQYIDSSILLCGPGGQLWEFDATHIHSVGSQIFLNTVADFRGMVLNGAQGFIVGAANTIFASDSGIGSWYQLNEPIPADLNAVAIVNSADTIIAVGDNGAIVKSTDFGKTWKSGYLGDAHNLYAIAFSGSTGVIVGSGGLILYSSNAGATWEREVSGTQFDLHGVALANGLWVAVGDNGTILTSAGPGCTSAFAANPNSITFTVPSHTKISQAIHIQNSSSASPLTVYASIIGDRIFSVNQGKIVVPENSSDSIVVSFIPTDSLPHTATLVLDNDADYSPDTIPINGNVPQSVPQKRYPSIGVSRNIIVFSYQAPCDIFDSILITNTGDTTLYITQISTTNPVWTPSVVSDSVLQGMTLPVFFHLKNQPHTAPLTGYAIIQSNAANTPRDSIYLLGSITEPAYVSVQLNTDSIRFNVNQSPEVYTDTLFMTNTGDTTLSVFSVTAFNSTMQFRFDFPDSILPCATEPIVVSFFYTRQASSKSGVAIQSSAPTMDTAYIFINAPVNVDERGINSPSLFQTNAFPNPAEHNLSLAFIPPIGGNATLIITNSLGEILLQQPVRMEAGVKGIIPLNMDFAHNGVYFYRLTCAGQTITGNFILDN